MSCKAATTGMTTTTTTGGIPQRCFRVVVPFLIGWMLCFLHVEAPMKQFFQETIIKSSSESGTTNTSSTTIIPVASVATTSSTPPPSTDHDAHTTTLPNNNNSSIVDERSNNHNNAVRGRNNTTNTTTIQANKAHQPPPLVGDQKNSSSGSSKIRFNISTILQHQTHPPKYLIEQATKERPYLAETHYRYGTFSLLGSGGLLFDGPALLPVGSRGVGGGSWPPARNNNASKEEAVCLVKKYPQFPQFPHHLQQLLRCFSWWQMNPHQRPVLRLEDIVAKRFTPRETRFIHDFYQGLQNVFGVRILDGSSSVSSSPHVTVPMALHQSSFSYAMNSPDSEKLANGFLNFFAPNNSLNNNRAGCPSSKKEEPGRRKRPTIGFLNREGSSGQSITNHKEILSALAKAGFYDNENQVRYQPNFDDMSLAEQIQFASEVDVLIGPHGPQFTITLFQPQCGSLFEFFNNNDDEDDYDSSCTPAFFGTLAALSGKHHSVLCNGKTTATNSSKPVNNMATTPTTFEVNADAVVQVTRHLVERWHSCCQDGFRQQQQQHQETTANQTQKPLLMKTSDSSSNDDRNGHENNRMVVTSAIRSSANTNDIQDAIDELPAWIQSYMKWHEKSRNEFISQHQQAHHHHHQQQQQQLGPPRLRHLQSINGRNGSNRSTTNNNNNNNTDDTNTTKFLVVLCQEGTTCGGLTDRLRSVLYWLREAEQTNRVLLIHWTKKYPLESFWVPPKGGLNWSLPLPQLQLVEQQQQQQQAVLSNVRNSSTSTSNATTTTVMMTASKPLSLFGPSSCIYQEEQVLKVSMRDETERQDIFKTLQDDTKQLVCVQTQANLNQIVMDNDYYFSDDSISSNQAKKRGRKRRRNLNGNDHHDRTFGRVYQIMFTPSLPLQGYIDNMMVNGLGLSSSTTTTTSPSSPAQVQEYLAAHIRSGYPLRGGEGGGLTRPNLKDVHPELVQQWAKNAVQQVVSTYYDSKKKKRHEGAEYIDDGNDSAIIPPVYVTADNEEVVKYLKSTTNLWTTINASNNTNRFVNITVLGLESMSRPHIEYTGTGNPANVYPAFFDLYMFSHSKCVSYGLGGYGLFGARLSGTGCMVQHRSSNNLRHYRVSSKDTS